MTSRPLHLLRQWITEDHFNEIQEIDNTISYGGVTLDLNQPTELQDQKTKKTYIVKDFWVFYQYKDKKIDEYANHCRDLGIQQIPLYYKNTIIKWLEGNDQKPKGFDDSTEEKHVSDSQMSSQAKSRVENSISDQNVNTSKFKQPLQVNQNGTPSHPSYSKVKHDSNEQNDSMESSTAQNVEIFYYEKDGNIQVQVPKDVDDFCRNYKLPNKYEDFLFDFEIENAQESIPESSFNKLNDKFKDFDVPKHENKNENVEKNISLQINVIESKKETKQNDKNQIATNETKKQISSLKSAYQTILIGKNKSSNSEEKSSDADNKKDGKLFDTKRLNGEKNKPITVGEKFGKNQNNQNDNSQNKNDEHDKDKKEESKKPEKRKTVGELTGKNKLPDTKKPNNSHPDIKKENKNDVVEISFYENNKVILPEEVERKTKNSIEDQPAELSFRIKINKGRKIKVSFINSYKGDVLVSRKFNKICS